MLPSFTCDDGNALRLSSLADVVQSRPGAYELPSPGEENCWQIAADGSSLLAWSHGANSCTLNLLRQSSSIGRFAPELTLVLPMENLAKAEAAATVQLRSALLSCDGQTIYGVFSTGHIVRVDTD